VDQVLNSDPDFFSRFQLVIVCGLPEKTLATVSSLCWQANIPLMAARSSGFLAYLRLQIKEHVVVEAHPESQSADLRLDQPWPALQQWLEEQAAAMPEMSLKDHGHTPHTLSCHALCCHAELEKGAWRFTSCKLQGEKGFEGENDGGDEEEGGQ